MISPRFLPALGALIGLALGAALLHRSVGAVDDGRATSRIPTSLAGFSSTPAQRSAIRDKQEFETNDWIQRSYAAGNQQVALTVVRSYDLKRLYHHPELAFAYGSDFVQSETRRLASRPSIPVHLLQSSDGRDVAMYVLHYDTRFVESPILLQIRTAGETLFSPRKPMTLFFVHERKAPPSGTDPGSRPSAALLFAAIDSFLTQESAASRGRP